MAINLIQEQMQYYTINLYPLYDVKTIKNQSVINFCFIML